MPVGVTIEGYRDCISTSDITDWFYFDDSEFKPCMTGCKRCTSADTCVECGDHADPSRKFFLDQTTTPHTCTQTACLLSNYQYSVGGAMCLQCTSTTFWVQSSSPPACATCDTTNRKYVDEADRLCKECPSHCAECTASGCSRCLDPNEYVQTDSTSCATTCSAREMKVEGPPKKCQSCPSSCADCNMTDSCTLCDTGFYLSSGSCSQCPSGCGTCTSSTECLTCSDSNHFLATDKLTCSSRCKQNEYSDPTDKKCKECEVGSQVAGGVCTRPDPQSLDYVIIQRYEPESKATASIELVLDHKEDMKEDNYKEVEANILAYRTSFKVTLIQKDSSESSEKNHIEIALFSIEKARNNKKNHFMMRVSLPSTMKTKIGDKHLLMIKSFKQNPPSTQQSSTDPFYLLKEKTSNIQIEILKTQPKELSLAPQIDTVATSIRHSNPVSATASIGLASILTVFSFDPQGSLLRFSQYLSFLNRIKLIGEFFGIFLEKFMEDLSLDEKAETNSDQTQSTNTLRLLSQRVLEMAHKRSKIEQESNGFQHKLDRFQISIFFEGGFMFKSIIYDISWIMKIIGIVLMSGMKANSTVNIWKIKFLVYQRKATF